MNTAKTRGRILDIIWSRRECGDVHAESRSTLPIKTCADSPCTNKIVAAGTLHRTLDPISSSPKTGVWPPRSEEFLFHRLWIRGGRRVTSPALHELRRGEIEISARIRPGPASLGQPPEINFTSDRELLPVLSDFEKKKSPSSRFFSFKVVSVHKIHIGCTSPSRSKIRCICSFSLDK